MLAHTQTPILHVYSRLGLPNPENFYQNIENLSEIVAGADGTNPHCNNHPVHTERTYQMYGKRVTIFRMSQVVDWKNKKK